MSSGNGTTHGYAVEARSMYTEPQNLLGQLFDQRWKQVQFNEKSPIGVPRCLPYDEPWLSRCGLFSYQAAQALRWWFHAAQPFGGLCVETRLVKYKVIYSYSTEREGEFCQIGGEDRSSIMPDGAKEGK